MKNKNLMVLVALVVVAVVGYFGYKAYQKKHEHPGTTIEEPAAAEQSSGEAPADEQPAEGTDAAPGDDS